jgi:hypothetical protein
MKKRNRIILAGAVLGLALLGLLTGAPAVRAELVSLGLGVDWWSVAGGGVNTSSGGNYTLSGAAGQAAADRLLGGNYSIQGGFWQGGAQQVKVYLPSIFR